MNAKAKSFVFVSFDASESDSLPFSGLEAPLRDGGSVCEQLRLPDDVERLLDRLEQGAVPVVVKPAPVAEQ